MSTTINVRMRAYRLFVDLCRKEHHKMFPEIKVTSVDFSKFCGLRWRQLTLQQKSKFEKLWLKSQGNLEGDALKEEDKSVPRVTSDGDGGDDVQISEEKKENLQSEGGNTEKPTSNDVKGVALGEEPGPAPKKRRSYVRKNPPTNSDRNPKTLKSRAAKMNLKKSGIKGVRPPYALFVSEVFGKARANNVSMKGSGVQLIAKEASKQWSEMPEEEKQKYRDRCEEDKIRYRREKEEHEKSLRGNISQEIGDDDESDVEEVMDDDGGE